MIIFLSIQKMNSENCFLTYFYSDITSPYPIFCVRGDFISMSDEKDNGRFVTVSIFSMLNVNR